MNKTGVVHKQQINTDESAALAALARLREDLSLSSTKDKKAAREAYSVFTVLPDGLKIKTKSGLKKSVTFISETDSRGRLVQHYMGICESTGQKQMLSRFKPTTELHNEKR